MIDMYLRTDTEAGMARALPFARGVDENGSGVWITATHDYSLGLIGPVVTTPGTYDAEGNEISAPVIDLRFHANLRCKPEIAEMVPGTIVIVPAPKTPAVRWA